MELAQLMMAVALWCAPASGNGYSKVECMNRVSECLKEIKASDYGKDQRVVECFQKGVK